MRNSLVWLITCLLFGGLSSVWAFANRVHHNMPEEGFLYMEFQGTNQMRWVADYLKAKTGGRYSGTCVNINYTPADMSYGDNTECGAIGIERIGGDKPDYFWDSFWDDTLFFNWHVEDFGLYGNNFTSWYHFVNLLKKTDGNDALITNNYNLYDGYAYNQNYGFPSMGIDWLLGTFMNNAQMSVNLPNCTDSTCAQWQGVSTVYKANPAIDYIQNNSTTPVSNGSGSKATEQADGTNYNCFSDVTLIGNCPDSGTQFGGTTQYANTYPGGGNILDGDEDWVIYEPATNAATFYYNEMWLEGLAAKNHSLQTGPISGRYYKLTGAEMLYFTVVQHWSGDMTQIAHIWSTIGYNHGDYESFAEGTYGKRQIGQGSPDLSYGSISTAPGFPNNYENYWESQAYANTWQNRYSLPVGNINKVLMEQVFRTYHNRYRAGYDFMTTSDHGVWSNAAVWAVRNATTETAIVTEKAVMDLRKCRNSGSCDNR